MSKKYQYFAKKRGSNRYFDAIAPCKSGNSNNYTNCNHCLKFAGYTRNYQKYGCGMVYLSSIGKNRTNNN